jgi:hypothetical protein
MTSASPAFIAHKHIRKRIKIKSISHTAPLMNVNFCEYCKCSIHDSFFAILFLFNNELQYSRLEPSGASQTSALKHLGNSGQ